VHISLSAILVYAAAGCRDEAQQPVQPRVEAKDGKVTFTALRGEVVDLRYPLAGLLRAVKRYVRSGAGCTRKRLRLGERTAGGTTFAAHRMESRWLNPTERSVNRIRETHVSLLLERTEIISSSDRETLQDAWAGGFYSLIRPSQFSSPSHTRFAS
jgi:hypothetical protein